MKQTMRSCQGLLARMKMLVSANADNDISAHLLGVNPGQHNLGSNIYMPGELHNDCCNHELHTYNFTGMSVVIASIMAQAAI
jgi:hypothetical protein